MDSTTKQRQTKYCQAIMAELTRRKHATNAELHISLRQFFPDVSVTTVHRASSRLASRGQIAVAPSTHDGSVRYDTNTEPHDHFMCTSCDLLVDAHVKDRIVPMLESMLDDCRISGQITVSGICKNCK